MAAAVVNEKAQNKALDGDVKVEENRFQPSATERLDDVPAVALMLPAT